MRPWRHVVIATATTAATALSFTNTHWDVWYADAFVISWNDNSTAVDLELFASGGNLTSDSARATIASFLLTRTYTWIPRYQRNFPVAPWYSVSIRTTTTAGNVSNFSPLFQINGLPAPSPSPRGGSLPTDPSLTVALSGQPLTTGTKVGIAVGIVVGALLFAGSIWWFCRKRILHRERRKGGGRGTEEDMVAELGGDKTFTEMSCSPARAELGEKVVVELETGANVCELDGRAVVVEGLGEKDVEMQVLVSPVEESFGHSEVVSPVSEVAGLDRIQIGLVDMSVEERGQSGGVRGEVEEVGNR